ncbi:CoA transferase [Micrococcaceae bacterium Sec5.7]
MNAPIRPAVKGPFEDLTVLDLSRALAGPHATMMMADMGARVIKVEAPGTGDDTRGWGPPFVGPEEHRESTYFLAANRGKESIALDLKFEPDFQTLTRLVEKSDVLVENFRPGVMDRLGLSTEHLWTINPRLIILSISGFGHDGPDGGRAGYDQIVQGEAGLMSVTGGSADNPTKVGVPIADLLAGMYGAYGVAAALYERHLTGRGRIVRTSLLAAVVGVHAFQGTRWTVAGETPHPTGNHHAAIAPYGLFKCADGIIQLAVGSENQWHKLATALALDPAKPEWATNAARVENRADLIEELEEELSRWTVADALTVLTSTGIPCGKLRSINEVYEWEQTRSQGLLLDVIHSTLGPITLPGPPVRYDDGFLTPTLPPPTLNEHGAIIRKWLSEENVAP